MAGASKRIIGQNPDVRSPSTRGPQGTNGDAASPDTPWWFIGETKGPNGQNDAADPNTTIGHLRYDYQLEQVNAATEHKARAAAITRWASNFFRGNPAISEIAGALSTKVDQALIAVNRVRESFQAGFFFDLTNWLPGANFRDVIDYAADLSLERSDADWLITYRIPRATAVAWTAVEDQRGKCEEHAFLALYLLTIGHMVQGMPFGQLRGDVFFAGAASDSHAVVILVAGSEFKQIILDSRKQPPANSLNWLYTHKNEWGNNAWVVDGWAGKAEKLSAFPIMLSSEKCESFRRNWKSTSRSEWDLTIAQMVERVSKAYGI